jgi:predicted HTH domain antitoxin
MQTMRTLTIEDLAREPQTLIAEAQCGRVTVITADGRAVMMALPLQGQGPMSSALIDLAAQLYDSDLISLERAARIAGLSYSETIDELGRRGIATIRTTPDELERELAAFGP